MGRPAAVAGSTAQNVPIHVPPPGTSFVNPPSNRATVQAGSARVRINGRAVSTDIIEASALAFLQVINRLSTRQQARLNPQTEAVAVS